MTQQHSFAMRSINQHPSPLTMPARRAAQPRGRAAAFVALIAGVLATSSGHAVVTLDPISVNISSAHTVPVYLDQTYWTDYSETCVFAGASSGSPPTLCGGTQPDPNPTANASSPPPPTGSDALLFSWGHYDAADSNTPLNSFLRLQYAGDASAPQSFTLDSLQFVSHDQPGDLLGPPNQSNNNPALQSWTQDKGLGTMVAYEEAGSPSLLLGSSDQLHYITEQLVAIRVLDVDPSSGSEVQKAEVRDWMVAVPESLAGVKSDGTDFYEPTPRDGFPDYRFVGDSGNPADGKTFFFTGSGLAEATDANKSQVTINPGDILEFQFYEASDCGPAGNETCWNNLTASQNDSRKPPDAYYGSFDLILNPAAGSELQVTPDPTLTLPDARAGDPTETTGSIQVENVGEGVIDGDFATLTGDTAEIGPAGTQSFNLGASATDQRDYTFDASGVIFDVSDAGSTGKTFTVTQDITSDADVNPNQTRTVEATAKSPILGVSNLTDESPETDDPNDWAFYAGQGNTIDLGAITVDDDFVIRDLILGNLFGAVDGTLTELTFYNAAITADPNGFFAIVGGEITPGGEALQAAQTRSAALQIRFDPGDTDIGTWTAQLDFLTDMYREHGVGAPGASTLSFTLQATLREAPSPGVLGLIGIGLVPLLAARRRAATTPGR